jgi:hypothetical protein
MKRIHIIATTVALAAAALLALAPGAVAAKRLEAPLIGDGVTGTAVYVSNGADWRFSVRISGAGQQTGHTLDCVVNGTKVGEMTVDAYGAAYYRRTSGQPGIFPPLEWGSTIEIQDRTPFGPIWIANGSFA